ncbi:MAG: lysine--tRNA ligase [Caldisericia bacterium]|nr:lysine--tRNA ligase [Caldisericia bacterium]
MSEHNLFDADTLQLLDEVREEGYDPYPPKYFPTHQAAAILSQFSDLENTSVTIAGRVITKRLHGKAGFAHLLSGGTKIQIYFRKDNLDEDTFHLVKKRVNVGDIIGITGDVFKTHTGEITVSVSACTLLSKALSPLPEKFHGIENVEVRYRQRYLDLIMNEDVRKTFQMRSAIVRSIRETLHHEGYMEVETPTLQDIYGGALAKPFTTHHNALDQDFYLRIAPELYLKRLIIGGFDKVFEIGKAYRNEGISVNHNPEFTLMELYEAYGNYETMMEISEKLIMGIRDSVLQKDTIEYRGKTINLSVPFRKMRLADAFEEFAHVDIVKLQDEQYAKEYLKKEKIHIDKSLCWANIVDEILKKKVEPHLSNPTFLYEYPLPLSPLAKKTSLQSQWVERFQLIMGSLEVGNAFTELNDPVDQQDRFLAQNEAKQHGDEEAHSFDRSYIEALKFGLPPTGGLGFGIDRIVMILTGSESIRDVLLFPQLRRREP